MPKAEPTDTGRAISRMHELLLEQYRIGVYLQQLGERRRSVTGMRESVIIRLR